MNPHRNDLTLGHLIFSCLEGSAEKERIIELESRLREDPEARRYYCEFLTVYSGLRRSAASLMAERRPEPYC